MVEILAASSGEGGCRLRTLCHTDGLLINVRNTDDITMYMYYVFDLAL